MHQKDMLSSRENEKFENALNKFRNPRPIAQFKMAVNVFAAI